MYKYMMTKKMSENKKTDRDKNVLEICFCLYNSSFNHSNTYYKKGVDNEIRSCGTKFKKTKKKVANFQHNCVPKSLNTLPKKRLCFGTNFNENQKEINFRSLQEQNSERNINRCNIISINQYSTTPTPDITLIVDETVLKCNSDLLKKFSGFFRRSLIDSITKINLCGQCINGETYLTCYKWMINDCDGVIDENNVVDVLCACLHLEITDLETDCWRLLGDERVFQGEKAFKIYKRGLDKGFHHITSIMFRRVAKFFPFLINTESFLESGKDYLIPILNSNEIMCESETVVFLAVCRWINYDIKERWNELNDIMESVRFGLMTSHQLFDIKNNKSDELSNIANRPYVRRKIESAIVLNSLKSEFNYPNDDEKSGFWLKCRQLGVDLEHPRNSSHVHSETSVYPKK